MKKTYQRITILILLIILLLLYALNANLIIKNILDYTDLFFKKLFPVSFLFFIFSSLLLDYGLIEFINNYLHLNGSTIYITTMSLISGFPSGSKYTKELLEKNLISEKTANYYITFTHFPNPLFVLGSVSTIIKNNTFIILILISLIIGNFITSIIFKTKEEKEFIPNYKLSESFSSSLANATINAVKVLITIYGTSIFFYLISTIINHYLTLSTYPYVITNGFFDLTKGVFSTTLINNNIIKSLFIIIFISLGGLSIHMQVKSILTNTKIKYKNFFFGRITSTIAAIISFLILIKLF